MQSQNRDELRSRPRCEGVRTYVGMNGIIGMTELALSTELAPEQREYLDLVKTTADALLSLIDDILRNFQN